jgi:predicted ATPase
MIPRIRQVRIRNYKSIEHAVVDLEPFTALIGPNGAGKSNFLDALAFVQDALSTSLDLAFKNRGGIGAVRRRSGGHPPNIALRLSLDLGDDRAADYEFEVTAKPREQFRVASERCAVGRFPEQEHAFEVQDGEFRQAIPGVRPKVRADRLALAAASATDEFGPVYDFLSSMRFYSIAPERLREWQEPDPGDFLHSDGRNAAAVLRRLAEEVHSAENYKRLCRFLARVADGIEAVEYRAVGKKETLQFKQNIGLKHAGTFDAAGMSDGTLRLVGLLLAIYQPGAPSLVAIEEPAAMVYPAVAELVVKALLDAANERQILVATHSPDILNCKELTDAHIRVAAMERDGTAIAPVSLSNRQAIQNHFYTPGQLLRSHEISPDLVAAREMIEQLDLFGKPSPDSGGTP